MKNLQIGTSDLKGSAIVIGCMRLKTLQPQDIATIISTSLEHDVNYFDHADIYGAGLSEELFAKAVDIAGVTRDKLILQSKCGIRPGIYDFSKQHILKSVDGILKRLNTDYLDALLLHRPDTLVEPDEVNEAFETLYKAGKVRNFGVSNHNQMQIELLKTKVERPLIINQMQFGPAHTGMIDAGINVNTRGEGAIDRDGLILDYCRVNNITLQTWSPLQYGMFEGIFFNSDKYKGLNDTLQSMADEKNTTKTALVTAWILRHPANMQVITGSTKPERILEMISGADVEVTRDEWYEIYRSAGNIMP